jgi:HSP20 family protein
MVDFRRDWLTDFHSMQREMEQLLDQFARRKPPMVRFAPSAWEPPVDMYETAQNVVVVAELAGVKQEEIRISVHAKTLIIRGGRTERQAGSDRTYYQMEISTGPFERGVLLPIAVDAEKATASYNDGILEIVLPKVSKERTRRVDIRTV